MNSAIFKLFNLSLFIFIEKYTIISGFSSYVYLLATVSFFGVSRDNEIKVDAQFLEALFLEIIIRDSITYNNFAV